MSSLFIDISLTPVIPTGQRGFVFSAIGDWGPQTSGGKILLSALSYVFTLALTLFFAASMLDMDSNDIAITTTAPLTTVCQ